LKGETVKLDTDIEIFIIDLLHQIMC
jgi:hypothetical protein